MPEAQRKSWVRPKVFANADFRAGGSAQLSGELTGANIQRALDGAPISEEEHEVVLHAGQPVVTIEAVPVERVRLVKEQVTGEQAVSGVVRKEQIETGTHGAADPGR